LTDPQNKLTIKEIILKGTIIAIIVTSLSLTGFFLSWLLFKEFLTAVVIGGIVHFIAMGFSLKISKKFFVKNHA